MTCSAEVDAVSANGVLYPQGDAVHAALRLFPMLYPRLIDIMQRLGASGYLIYERYFAGDPVSMMATRYLDYDKATAVERVQALVEASHRP